MATLAQNYSGVVLDQNATPGPTDFLMLTGSWYFQELFLPDSYVYGLGSERRYPSLSGFQLLVKIPEGRGPNAILNWRLEYDVVGVGWIPLERGSQQGAHVSGETVWMDVFFPQPVEISETIHKSSIRIGFQAQQNIEGVWFAQPNPLPKSEAYVEETPLSLAFNFRLLALTADGGTDFLGNSYRSIVVDEPVENTLSAADSAWRSSPQPSKFAVVSSYYDVRQPPTFGTLNLLTNPSFEYGLQTWETKSFFVSGPDSALSLVPGNAASGKASLRVQTAGVASEGVTTIFPSNEAFVQGHSYTTSLYLRSDATTPAEITLILGTAGDEAELKHIIPNTTWQRFSVTWQPKTSFVSDGTSGSKGVSLSLVVPSTTATSFFVDAAQVTPTPSPVPYIDGDLLGSRWTGIAGQSTSVEVNQKLTVIDSVLLDPQVPNFAFSVYYSNDGDANDHTSTEEWEQKLWTRVPQTYLATQRQQYVFPEPIKASFVKIEYSNLQAQSYNVGDFAKPVIYKKFPIWVADFFIAQLELPSFIANTVGVSYDALEFAYDYFLDDLVQKPAKPLTSPESLVNTLSQFFNNSDAANLVDPETLTQINLVMNKYVSPPAALGNPSTLLGSKQGTIAFNQANYPTEATPEQITRGLGNVSRLNRENIVFENSIPVMFFFLTCRHAYKELSAAFADNKAYFAGVKEVVFLRNDYTTMSDDELYIESGGDTVNIERNDFVIHDDSTWTSY